VAAAIWLGGIALFQGINNFAPEWGATLPALAATFALAWLTRARS
jgi:nucleobase:cation symporter-1, NCS1 family